MRKFRPDIIYLDPSRRGAAGRKVFRLNDCRPDILRLKDILLTLAPTVIVKLSPMADIDAVLGQLGPSCRRLDVISIDNECKELLVTLVRAPLPQSGTARKPDRECDIVADCGQANSFRFLRSEEASANPKLLSVPDPDTDGTSATKSRPGTIAEYLTGRILLEPDKALLKAGPFKLLSSNLGLTKLDVSTHYYTHVPNPDTTTPLAGNISPGEAEPRDATFAADIPAGLFRQFRILRAEPLNNRTLKAVGKEFPDAEVTARNIPMNTDELRRRLNSGAAKSGKPGPEADTNTEPGPHTETEIPRHGTGVHIFGLRAAGVPLLLVTERIRDKSENPEKSEPANPSGSQNQR